MKRSQLMTKRKKYAKMKVRTTWTGYSPVSQAFEKYLWNLKYQCKEDGKFCFMSSDNHTSRFACDLDFRFEEGDCYVIAVVWGPPSEPVKIVDVLYNSTKGVIYHG